MQIASVQVLLVWILWLFSHTHTYTHTHNQKNNQPTKQEKHLYKIVTVLVDVDTHFSQKALDRLFLGFLDVTMVILCYCF